jgi:NitT/TauT family transport system substrate-binding protein
MNSGFQLRRSSDRTSGPQCWRAALGGALALIVLATSGAAQAREQVRIGIGYGLAFLPAYICEDGRLIEKYARQLHLDVKASYQRFPGAAAVQDAIASGAIDMAPFGIAPLLRAWEQTADKRQILAVSGITTMPLVLLSDRTNVHAIGDLRPADRIAMPTRSAPQMYMLEMQSEKVFGQYDRLREQVVALPHADAIADLMAGSGPVTAYFSSPPFTQIASQDAKIHPILRSQDVIGGKASFLILGARRGYIEAHARIPEIVDRAMDEAARTIRDDPAHAARIFLAHEPSRALDAPAIEAVLRQNKDEFGSALQGVAAFAAFMGRHGELKQPPKSWKDIVAPSLLNSPSS